MLEIEPSTKFKKDVKNLKKGGKLKENELKIVVTTLQKEEPLPAKCSQLAT